MFLPTTGISIDSSATLLSSMPDKNGREEWLNVYGASDIIMPLKVEPIAPDGFTHKEYCVGPTVDVVAAVYESWRQVPVRGTLRISASYYLSDPNLHASLTDRPERRIATLALPIPCPEGGCDPGCNEPPFIVEGEHPEVPNIAPQDPASIERGNAGAAGENRSPAAQPGAASQRAGPDSPDRDPGTGRVGECANGFGEFGARAGQILMASDCASVAHDR